MNQINSIILDFDTIFDTFWVHDKAWKDALHHFNCSVRRDFVEEIFGIGQPYLDQALSKEYKKISARRICATKQQIFDKLWHDEEILPTAGIVNFIKACKGNKFKLGCVSSHHSTDVTKQALKILQVDKYFDFVVGKDEFEPAKPNPLIYEIVAQKLNVQPEQCFVFESSNAGYASAIRAKTHCIRVTGKISANWWYDVINRRANVKFFKSRRA